MMQSRLGGGIVAINREGMENQGIQRVIAYIISIDNEIVDFFISSHRLSQIKILKSNYSIKIVWMTSSAWFMWTPGVNKQQEFISIRAMWVMTIRTVVFFSSKQGGIHTG